MAVLGAAARPEWPGPERSQAWSDSQWPSVSDSTSSGLPRDDGTSPRHAQPVSTGDIPPVVARGPRACSRRRACDYVRLSRHAQHAQGDGREYLILDSGQTHAG